MKNCCVYYVEIRLYFKFSDLTLNFVCKVGDFGLARWQTDGGKGVETRVIGTFG